MTQENIRPIDEMLKNTTLLLETIASEIVHSTSKIYASYPPGEITSSLFKFEDDIFLKEFTDNFDLIKKVLKKELSKLPYEREDEVIILANLLTEIKEYDMAIEIYSKLSNYNPDNQFAWANLMSIYMLQGKHEEAMDCYLRLRPDFIEHSNNEKKDSTSDAYRILNISTTYPLPKSLKSLTRRAQTSTELKQQFEHELRELYANKDFVNGQEALANNNTDEAFILFSSVVLKQPDSHVILFFTGKAAFEGKHYLIAEEYFKKALQIKNDIPEYWNELADCFFAQYKNEQAIKAIKTALTLDPACLECWTLAGKAIATIESMGEYEYFIKQIQLMSSAESIVRFVTGLISRKKYDNSLEILQIGVSKFPENAGILENLALVYERMGRVDEAISIYEELLMSGKEVQKYLQKITSILTLLHDDKRLVRILKMVSSYLPWDETTLWNKIGDLLMRAKDYLGASEAFRKVISFDPADSRIQFNLGLAYQELSLYKKAEETYKKVLKLNPEDHA
ncbi:MAG: tetratricopeptide repeat protein, partial [Candidatus Heimdallarchaeota archaeon]|nr:tetratricopeptide repeat protein [Candidatus Heimdallarchaeota archaeon]